MGQAPEGSSYNTSRLGYPLIAGAGDFNGTGLAPTKYTTRPTRLAPAGTILLGIRASIGARARADSEICLGRGVAAIRPGPDLNDAYLWHWLGFSGSALAAKGRGATFKQVSRQDITDLPIPLVPLSEQRRLARILDAADRGQAKRHVALALLHRLRAVRFNEMFGDPVVNPKAWPTERLTAVCRCVSGGTPDRRDLPLWEGAIPWFSAKDLKAEDVHDSQEHVSEAAVRRLTRFPPNTVVILVRGMMLRRRIPVSVLRTSAVINQDLKALLPLRPIEVEFLAAQLRAQERPLLGRVTASAHGTARLDTAALNSLQLVLPPIEHQREFAVQSRKIRRLQELRERALHSANALFASLQYRAFADEL